MGFYKRPLTDFVLVRCGVRILFGICMELEEVSCSWRGLVVSVLIVSFGLINIYK